MATNRPFESVYACVCQCMFVCVYVCVCMYVPCARAWNLGSVCVGLTANSMDRKEENVLWIRYDSGARDDESVCVCVYESISLSCRMNVRSVECEKQSSSWPTSGRSSSSSSSSSGLRVSRVSQS